MREKRIQMRMNDPSQPPRRDSRNPPPNSTLAQFRGFFLKQAYERLIDVAQPQQAEIVGANRISSAMKVRSALTHGRGVLRQDFV